MAIKINVTGLEDFAEKAKVAAKSLAETPVPLGKTVIGTIAIITVGELLLLRKMKFTLVLTRRY